MKDAYSFDRTQQDAFKTYDVMVQAYKNIFDRLKVRYVVVEADTGNIGGSKSHELQVLSDVGEDSIIHCSCSARYAANVEKAVGSVHSNGTLPEGRVPSAVSAKLLRNVLA